MFEIPFLRCSFDSIQLKISCLSLLFQIIVSITIHTKRIRFSFLFFQVLPKCQNVCSKRWIRMIHLRVCFIVAFLSYRTLAPFLTFMSTFIMNYMMTFRVLWVENFAWNKKKRKNYIVILFYYCKNVQQVQITEFERILLYSTF